VGNFPNRPVAELARTWLEERGVDATVTADDGGGSSPEVGFVTGGASLLVAADQVERAEELLAELPAPAVRPRTRRPAERGIALLVVATMSLGAMALLLYVLLLAA
jgi:hypothetical protein